MHNSRAESGLTAENMQLLNHVLTSIPGNATVSAEYQIAPHIHTYYKQLSIWPTGNATEDFIIIDTELAPVLGARGEDYNKEIDKLNKNTNYQLAVGEFGILVYRKKSFLVN